MEPNNQSGNHITLQYDIERGEHVCKDVGGWRTFPIECSYNEATRLWNDRIDQFLWYIPKFPSQYDELHQQHVEKVKPALIAFATNYYSKWDDCTWEYEAPRYSLGITHISRYSTYNKSVSREAAREYQEKDAVFSLSPTSRFRIYPHFVDQQNLDSAYQQYRVSTSYDYDYWRNGGDAYYTMWGRLITITEATGEGVMDGLQRIVAFIESTPPKFKTTGRNSPYRLTTKIAEGLYIEVNWSNKAD